MSDVYKGRLASTTVDGVDHLVADQRTQTGEKKVRLVDEDGSPVLDEDGNQETQIRPVYKYGPHHWKPVYHDVEAGVYRFVEEGGLSHNERHGKRTVGVGQATSGPLFDADGKQVFAGDPHHERPTPDDIHYAADGGGLDKNGQPTFTRTTSIPDEIAPVATGHTEAYT